MPLASWIVATHFRPRLLEVALEALAASPVPSPWEVEIVVAHHERDVDAPIIAHRFGAIAVSTTKQTGGAKRNVALRASRGELVLPADDDDIQSPNRLRAAITAYVNGYALTGCKEFRYVHRVAAQDRVGVGRWAHPADGLVVRWNGAGGLATDRPPVYVGTARNFRRSMLEGVGGWADLPRLIEKDLQFRLVQRYPAKMHVELDLTRSWPNLANETVCIQHDANIWGDRPALTWGQTVTRGDFVLTGEGYAHELANFPAAAATYLARL